MNMLFATIYLLMIARGPVAGVDEGEGNRIYASIKSHSSYDESSPSSFYLTTNDPPEGAKEPPEGGKENLLKEVTTSDSNQNEDYRLSSNRLQTRILDRRKLILNSDPRNGRGGPLEYPISYVDPAPAYRGSFSYLNQSMEEGSISYVNQPIEEGEDSISPSSPSLSKGFESYGNQSLFEDLIPVGGSSWGSSAPVSFGNSSWRSSAPIAFENESVLAVPNSFINVSSATDDVSIDQSKMMPINEAAFDWQTILALDDHSGNDNCRTRDGRFLPPELFSWDSCAHCYVFEFRKPNQTDRPWNPILQHVELNQKMFPVLFLEKTVVFNDSNSTNQKPVAAIPRDALFESVSDLKFRDNWQKCCAAAINCCHKMLTTRKTNSTNVCPRTWDGWQCWGDAKPNTEVYEQCPDYAYINTHPACAKLAAKRCEIDGQWYRKNGMEWSDYSPCGILPNIQLRILCHICALFVSVLALTPALLIFSCYRQLRVHRITLHKQLFISLLFEACCTISLEFIQLSHVGIISENPSWCVFINLVRKYARQTNYMWYLCEGFYLHKLLAAAFAEQRSLALFYVIGWGLPLIPIMIYALLRGLLYQSSHCWEFPIAGIEWLIQLPPLLAILINLIFLVNIIRILLSKVRAGRDNEPCQYRMAVRAAVMVIPLFGLQYIITIYRPKGQACDWFEAYLLINNIIDGSTGFVVAIIFCFANGEVRSLLRRSWKRKMEKRPPFGSSRSSRSSFPFGSRSMSNIQSTFISANPSRRTSSIISMNIGSNFGSRYIFKNLVHATSENHRLDRSRRSECIQEEDKDEAQFVDIAMINDSNFSLSFLNSQSLRSPEEGSYLNDRNVRPSDVNERRILRHSAPNQCSVINDKYWSPEEENLTFIDDEIIADGEDNSSETSNKLYCNTDIGMASDRPLHLRSEYYQNKCLSPMEEDIF